MEAVFKHEGEQWSRTEGRKEGWADVGSNELTVERTNEPIDCRGQSVVRTDGHVDRRKRADGLMEGGGKNERTDGQTHNE